MSFGPFRLFPAARVLQRDGRPLALGNRALDILIVLVERAGEVVNHRDLLARVWRGLVVSPGNLRVHMSALRNALDGSGEIRYIANVTGQGYCFVAPVERRDESAHEALAAAHLLLAGFPDGERLVGPGVVAELKRIVSAIASAVALTTQTDGAFVPSIARHSSAGNAAREG